MNDVAIHVEGLRKLYGRLEALRGVDLEVHTGEVLALLGPNGAGKTTIVEILEGYRKRSAGNVSVLGHDPERGEAEYRKRIGIVLQGTGVERFLRVEEVIDLYRSYYPAPLALDEVIEIVGLREQRSQLVRSLSGGQQRRLDVAVGLAGDPELLFLDEPTTGFDPSARRSAWNMIENLKALGKTVMLTTHYMDEAQNLADRVSIIARGKIVAEGDPASLAGRDAATRIAFRLEDETAQLPAALQELATSSSGVIEIRADDSERVLHQLTGWAIEHGVRLRGLHVAQPSLEDVYLQITEDAK